jgi:large subunit ribosomal protein L35
MPKLKTHKGAAKRFKKTGTGKIVRHKAGLRHILSSKAKKRKKQLGKATLVSDGDYKKAARMIPYYVMERRASAPVLNRSMQPDKVPI